MDFEQKKLKVDHLLRRKFPSSWAPPPFSLPGAGRVAHEVDRFNADQHAKMMDEIQADRILLNSLPPDELEMAFQQSLERDRTREKLKAELDERRRFFNQPDADADFGYWSKVEYWSMDESVALLLGKTPEVVSWDRVQKFVGVSAFAKLYERVRNLALRAATMNRGQSGVYPTDVLRWAAEMQIPVPEALNDAMARHIVHRQQVSDQRDHAARLAQALLTSPKPVHHEIEPERKSQADIDANHAACVASIRQRIKTLPWWRENPPKAEEVGLLGMAHVIDALSRRHLAPVDTLEDTGSDLGNGARVLKWYADYLTAFVELSQAVQIAVREGTLRLRSLQTRVVLPASELESWLALDLRTAAHEQQAFQRSGTWGPLDGEWPDSVVAPRGGVYADEAEAWAVGVRITRPGELLALLGQPQGTSAVESLAVSVAPEISDGRRPPKVLTRNGLPGEAATGAPRAIWILGLDALLPGLDASLERPATVREVIRHLKHHGQDYRICRDGGPDELLWLTDMQDRKAVTKKTVNNQIAISRKRRGLPG